MLTLNHFFQEASKSNPLVKTLTPIICQIGFGGVIGFGLGFLLKKVGKIVVAVLALIFIGIQILIYYGYIPGFDWTRLSKDITGAVDNNFLNSLWNLIINNLPFVGSFTIGFLWGGKKG